MSILLISAVARISGIQETASQTNMINRGKINAPSTDILKVWTQRNVVAGAALMFDVDQYPVKAETRQPTKRPTMTDEDFIRGDPNCSTKTMETNTVNPSPISFG